METARIYLDHAATTPLDPDALQAMLPFLHGGFGNPSSIYQRGREARRALDEARDTVAAAIGARSPREIIFTSGGAEADNLALKGAAWALRDRGRHIVTSAIEHHAVLRAARFLEKHGFEVTYVPPDEEGIVQVDAVAGALRDDTILISVM
ncbi:MAG: aminotransferase class V-fold PLP-dependent enzyme, partial [Clostridia bacterium]